MSSTLEQGDGMVRLSARDHKMPIVTLRTAGEEFLSYQSDQSSWSMPTLDRRRGTDRASDGKGEMCGVLYKKLQSGLLLHS